MSTVVYHGFRLDKAWNDPGTMRERLGGYRRKVQNLAMTYARNWVASLAVEFLDRKILGLPLNDTPPKNPWTTPDENPWLWAAQTVQYHLNEARMKGHDADLPGNLECTVVLYPRKTHWLARVCPDSHPEYVRLFAKLPGVTSYEVDTRTDPPKDIPRRTYRSMVKEWEDTDDGPRLFCECLGTYGWPMPPIKSCVPHQPTKTRRAHDLAIEQCLGVYLKAHPMVGDADLGAVFRAQTWLREDPEGQKLLKTTEKSILTKLPERYTYTPAK